MFFIFVPQNVFGCRQKEKRGKSIQIHFRDEKLWEQGFGGWGGVAAIDTGFKMFFGMGWDGKDYWVLVELISKREKESKYICKYILCVYFRNEKLWEQGFGGRGEVAAIDSG